MIQLGHLQSVIRRNEIEMMDLLADGHLNTEAERGRAFAIMIEMNQNLMEVCDLIRAHNNHHTFNSQNDTSTIFRQSERPHQTIAWVRSERKSHLERLGLHTCQSHVQSLRMADGGKA